MGEQGAAGPGPDLSWLLNDLVDRVADFRQVVILSRDGLVVAASRELSREDAEHLSALAAGVQSLARGAGRHFGVGEVRQTIIELDQALLFVTAAGLVAYEMAMLVKRAGPRLGSQARFPAAQSRVE